MCQPISSDGPAPVPNAAPAVTVALFTAPSAGPLTRLTVILQDSRDAERRRAQGRGLRCRELLAGLRVNIMNACISLAGLLSRLTTRAKWLQLSWQ